MLKKLLKYAGYFFGGFFMFSAISVFLINLTKISEMGDSSYLMGYLTGIILFIALGYYLIRKAYKTEC